MLDKKDLSDEEKMKESRRILRKIYSGFGGKRILGFRRRSAEEILEKHLSTRERLPFYRGIYSRILKWFDKKKKISVIDLGAGVNGFSFGFFGELGFRVKYSAVEAVGQLADMTNEYFKNEKKDGVAYPLSLFQKEKILDIIKNERPPRLLFLFKVIDSLEVMQRNYTKDLLISIKETLDESDVIALSFATESWFKRRKFYVERTWIIDFLRENFKFIDDFKEGGERYLVFRK
jgi:hypothetical protein